MPELSNSNKVISFFGSHNIDKIFCKIIFVLSWSFKEQTCFSSCSKDIKVFFKLINYLNLTCSRYDLILSSVKNLSINSFIFVSI